MIPPEPFDPLRRLTLTERARTVVAASASVVWAVAGDAGVAPFDQECGLPLLLGDDALSAGLLGAGSGRVEFDRHPELGVLRLAGQFWSVANPYAIATLDQVRRHHADCTDCPAARFTQVVGLQVVTASLRLPGERDFRPLDLDDYVLAQPDPVAVAGAALTVHLNVDHRPELAVLATALTGIPASEQFGVRVGLIDVDGFELVVVGPDGGSRLAVRFATPITQARQLPDLMHDAIATAIHRAD